MLLSEWRINHHRVIRRVCSGVYFKGGCWSAKKIGIELDDFVQNILMELYTMGDQVLVSPRKFTETIAKRRMMDLIRKASRTKVTYSGLFESEAFSDVFLAKVDPSMAEVELTDRIEPFRRKLDEDDFKVLLLRFQQSLSVEETAKRLNISVSSVKRASRRIRELASDQGPLAEQINGELSLDA
jgi:RNA polymerase sigma factor (sigma-70 family)